MDELKLGGVSEFWGIRLELLFVLRQMRLQGVIGLLFVYFFIFLCLTILNKIIFFYEYNIGSESLACIRSAKTQQILRALPNPENCFHPIHKIKLKRNQIFNYAY